MRVKSSISEIDAQIEKLREERKNLIVKKSERFSRAAIKAGLAELDIPDAEIETMFDDIARRFRKDAPKPAGSV